MCIFEFMQLRLKNSIELFFHFIENQLIFNSVANFAIPFFQGSNLVWQTDTGEMFEFEGYSYFLVVVDCFSRKLFTRPLEKLDGDTVKKAFLNIIRTENNNIYPPQIEADLGKEYFKIKKYLQKRK